MAYNCDSLLRGLFDHYPNLRSMIISLHGDKLKCIVVNNVKEIRRCLPDADICINEDVLPVGPETEEKILGDVTPLVHDIAVEHGNSCSLYLWRRDGSPAVELLVCK